MLASVAAGSAGSANAQAPDADPPLATAAPSAQDQAFAADFERFLDRAMARFPSMPAISVAIVHRGVPVFVNAKGRADVEAGIAATPDTPFYIASSTKSFVGTAFALLDARGTIDLDWTMRELAPDIAFAPDVPADKISLRDLLAHRHGLAGDAMAFRLAYSGEYDDATLLRLLAQIRPDPDTPPGSFRYGNIGYNIAALLVERRIGRRWQDIVQDELLAPLAMTETLTEGLAERRGAPVAAPYRGGERLYLVKDDRTMHAAGGMYASASDMARWLTLQLQDKGELAQAAATARAPVATLDGAFGPFRRTGYGLGWYTGPYAEQTLYHAFGSFVGARAHVSVLPAAGLGVAAATNDEGAGFRIVDLAALYTYDWYLHGAMHAEAKAAEQIETLAGQWARQVEKVAAQRAERAARASQLTLPAAAYAGDYCNADYGTIGITPQGARLDLTMGRLHAAAEPGEAPDTIRAELIPGQGEEFRFVVTGGVATAIEAFGSRFDPCIDSGGKPMPPPAIP
ncbi:MAG: serine hydrolase [Sphingopyxis sp.]|uniref:serine hydrolase domain-containing protein n=1 Tax=Sphingopyxis sp. TaxID=1908224 RepID=UPI001A55586B|nr:serine hydrolase domain-containing protein [Sphingopyxis sp.]MBL9067222.1 serine hydrolase [Sphingopyxis sp.]